MELAKNSNMITQAELRQVIDLSDFRFNENCPLSVRSALTDKYWSAKVAIMQRYIAGQIPEPGPIKVGFDSACEFWITHEFPGLELVPRLPPAHESAKFAPPAHHQAPETKNTLTSEPDESAEDVGNLKPITQAELREFVDLYDRLKAILPGQTAPWQSDARVKLRSMGEELANRSRILFRAFYEGKIRACEIQEEGPLRISSMSGRGQTVISKGRSLSLEHNKMFSMPKPQLLYLRTFTSPKSGMSILAPVDGKEEEHLDIQQPEKRMEYPWYDEAGIALSLLLEAAVSSRDILEQLRQASQSLIAVAGGIFLDDRPRNREDEGIRVRYYNDAVVALDHLWDSLDIDPGASARLRREAESLVIRAAEFPSPDNPLDRGSRPFFR